MKKTIFLLLVTLSIVSNLANAQNLIAVQNGGNPTFYLQVNDAIANAQDGDTIYIPGGVWVLNQGINKNLHLVGGGHHPDSTNATFQTSLIGTFILQTGASNGSLTGIDLQGLFYIPNGDVDNFTVSRCRISDGVILNSADNNLIFFENVIKGRISGMGGIGASSCSFFNNVIDAEFCCPDNLPNNNCIYKNNIFLYNAFCYWGGCSYSISTQYSIFENNVFISTLGFYGVSNSITRNNLFVEGISFPNGTNVGSNNIVNQPQSSIFVNQSGNSFSYGHDYHLQPTCPGKNAGTDGTDVGIYGGIYPWKDGSLPFNPHIQTVQVSPTTSTSGGLNVNIKVAAQDH